MKPCRTREETLTLLAVGALTKEETETIQLHLETCEACRRYAARLESMCRRLTKPGREVQQLRLPERFGQRLRERLATERSIHPRTRSRDSSPAIEAIRAWFRFPRLAMATGMIACFLLLIWVRPDHSHSRDQVPASESAANDPGPTSHRPARSPSSRTLFAYQKALSESPEALDALVLMQAQNDRGGEGMTMHAQASAQF